MTSSAGGFCTHCRLPLGLRPMQRTLDGELCSFCCYGCCIAYQVKAGRKEEFEAAWLLIRLGVGGFLSMNVMLISLVIYAGAFDADAWLIPWIHLLLWIFATPALVILGEPYLRETLANARQGRLTSSALVVLGVGAAYAYSVFATIEQSAQVYFDTATMVLMLFTVGSYHRGGRPRQGGARPGAAACRRERMRDRGGGRPRGAPPRSRDRRRHARAGPPGRTRARRRPRRRGRVPYRRGGDHRGEPPHRQGRRLGDDCRQRQSRRAAIDREQRRGERDPVGDDLPLGARRAFASQPAAACRRPGGRHLRARCPRARRADGPLLGELASLRRGAAGRARGAGGRLPVRSGPRRSACNLARHRTPGALRLPRPRPRRARGPGAHAAHRLR